MENRVLNKKNGMGLVTNKMELKKSSQEAYNKEQIKVLPSFCWTQRAKKINKHHLENKRDNIV